jgi:HSP20 family protein
MISTKRNWFWMTTFAHHPHDSIDYHHPSVRCCAQGWWAPDADMYEVDDGMVIIIDLAGVSREEVSMVVEGKMLSISGTRRQPSIPDKKSVHLLEIDFGSFVKRFSIPADFDETRIEVRYENGLLHLHLPRFSSRQVPVE